MSGWVICYTAMDNQYTLNEFSFLLLLLLYFLDILAQRKALRIFIFLNMLTLLCYIV